MTQIEKRQKFLLFRNEMYQLVQNALTQFYEIDYKHDIRNFVYENSAEGSKDREFARNYADCHSTVFNGLTELEKLLKAENIQNIFPENKEK